MDGWMDKIYNCRTVHYCTLNYTLMSLYVDKRQRVNLWDHTKTQGQDPIFTTAEVLSPAYSQHLVGKQFTTQRGD